MDNVQITHMDGEPPIFREMKPVPVTLESCILHSAEDFSYDQAEQASVSQDNCDNGELSAEEISSMIMINEGPNALSSAQEELESSRASASIRNSSDIKKILTSDLPKSGRFLSTKSLQKLSGAKKIIKKNSKYANEDETDIDDPIDVKVKKMLTKQSKTVKENLNKSDKNKIDCKNNTKNVKIEKLRVKSLKRKNSFEKLPIEKKSLKALKKAATNKCKGLNLEAKIFKKKVLGNNTAIMMKGIISEHEELESESKKIMSKTTKNVKKKFKTENKSKLLISRSGRIRKIKEASGKNKEGKILNPELDEATMTVPTKDETDGKTEIVKEPMSQEVNSKMENSRENKSQRDLLQSALSESIESWFDMSPDLEKKGKRARGKVKIIPKDFDNCFEETKNVQAEKNCHQIISENSEKIHSDFIKSDYQRDEENDVNKINNIEEAKINEDDTYNSQNINITSIDIIEGENIKSVIEEPISYVEENKDENDKKLAALNGKKVKTSNRQLMVYKRKRRKARNICVTRYLKNYGERIDFDVKIDPKEVETKKRKNFAEKTEIKKHKTTAEEILTKKEKNATEENEINNSKTAAEEIETKKQEHAAEEIEPKKQKNAADKTDAKKQENAVEEIDTKKQENAVEEIETKKQENGADKTDAKKQENAVEEIEPKKQKNAAEKIDTKKQENAAEEIEPKKQKNAAEKNDTKKQENAAEDIEIKKQKNVTKEIKNKKQKNILQETENVKKKLNEDDSSNNFEVRKQPELKLTDFYKPINKTFPRCFKTNSIKRSQSAENLQASSESEENPQKSVEMPASLPFREKELDPKINNCSVILEKGNVDSFKAENKKMQKNEDKEQKITARKKHKIESVVKKEIIPEEQKEKEIERHAEIKLENEEVQTNKKFKVQKKKNGSAFFTKVFGMRSKRKKMWALARKEKFPYRRRKLSVKKQFAEGFGNLHTINKSVNSVGTDSKENGKIVEGSNEKQETGESFSTSSALSIPLKKRPRRTKTNETPEEIGKENKKRTNGSEKHYCERRKSHREIKLTPKIVDMIAISFSHKRSRKSSSSKEESTFVKEESMSTNSRQKLAGGSEAKTRPTEQPLEAVSSVENYLQSKMDANASNFESSWEPGDLVWARFAGNPFWPAVILRDPFNNDEYSRVKYLGRLPRPFVHVQFLADYGRRAWGPELYIMTFNGLEEFEKLKSSLPEVNAFTQRKDLIYQQAFFTPKKLEKNWVEAVKEADTLINRSKDERITYMKIKYPLVKYAASVANGRLVPNERTKNGDLKSPQPKRRKRRKLKDAATSTVWPHKDRKDTFECVNTSDMDERIEKSEKESPKITLKLVRSPKRGPKRKSSKSIDEMEEKNIKKRIRKEMLDDDYVPSDSGSYGEKGSETLSSKQKKYFLFKGARTEKVCQICVEILENEKTVKCKGSCQGLFHKSCAEKMSADLPPLEEGFKKGFKNKRRKKLFASVDSDNSTDAQTKESSEKEWRCNDCLRGENPCFVCNSRSGNRQRCCVSYCGKFYHQKCLKLYPQTIYNHGAPIRKLQSLQQNKAAETESPHYQILSCPLHVCHTCASDNPADFNMKYLCEKLVKCIKCPSAYHGGNFCVPAGSTILNTNQIICAKHGDPGKKSHVNISWCFICNMGGSLICCEWCPSSFHLDCLNLKPPDGPYICEECESGRFPLYGEVVWVKLGRYRWWPARILFPQEILPNILALPHKSWEFAVRFYGSNDHYWLNRGRVFLYQEGDSEQKFKGQSHVDKIYQKAVQDATKDYFAIQEERKSRLSGTTNSGIMKPPPYVKIKTNKAVGKVQLGNLSQSEPQTCDCDPNSETPCSPGTNCLNRMLLVECNPNYCNAGSRCENQSFEKREYPPLEPYRTETRGWGLRTSIDIPKGAFVIEYVGEVVDDEEFRRRMKRKQETKDSNYYFLTIDKDRMIDAGPKGNLARFMNHSCSPNCETQKWTVNGDTRVGLFALRDIPAGAELTFNYNLDCIGNEKKPCHCEEENCSGFIGIKAKNDKSESLKSKMVKRLDKESEDECFVCNDGGELMVCDVPNCPKVYHLECVNLTEWPNELWFCPRHRCCLCSRTTKRCCKLCPTAYCFAHLDNNIFSDNQGGLLCSKHITCAVKPAQILRKASYVNRNTPIIEYEKPFAEKYRPPPQKERISPEEKKEEILMEPNLTDNTPIVVENPLLSSATPSSLNDGVSVQVLYVDEEGQIVSVDGSTTSNTGETTTNTRESEEIPKPVKRRKRTNIPRKKLNPPVVAEEIENKKKSPAQGGINFESLMIKSVEDKILDSKLNMDNIYNIIGGGGEGERETGQTDSAERCIRDDSNDLKSETVSKKEDAEVDRSRRSKYFKIITPEKFIKVSESESNQKKVTDFNYIEFMHPLRSARSKTKTDENTRK